MRFWTPIVLLGSSLLLSCTSDRAEPTAYTQPDAAPPVKMDEAFDGSLPAQPDAAESASDAAAVDAARPPTLVDAGGWDAGTDAGSPEVEPTPADIAYDAYTEVFYTEQNGEGYYVNTTGTARADAWWTQAELIEMAVDALERKPTDRYKALVVALIRGFVARHGRDWTYNDFNDDIAWMVIACLRAHQQTGEPDFLALAQQNWDAMYARAASDDYGGGLWWKVNVDSKNACINGPGAIGAYLLYKATGDASYLSRAQDIYAWERRTLFDTQSGAIYDNINPNGGDKWTFTYNTGTFIGIANYLFQETGEQGYFDDARLAADFARRELSDGDGLIRENAITGDGAAFKPIMFRWLAKFVRENGLESDYLPWLQYNANRAWANRRAGDNISWNDWTRATPHRILVSHGAMATVQILQVVPQGGARAEWYNAAPQASRAQLQAEHCDEMRGPIIEAEASGGEQLGGVMDGAWARYGQVDFGSASPTTVRIRAAVDASAGGTALVHVDAVDGPIVARVALTSTGNWSTYQAFTAPLAATTGVHDVYLVFVSEQGKQYVANVDWFLFE